MNAHVRVFEDRPAVREAVPLLVGLMGASGSGKTVSALRLATGIQAVCGGEIYVIDTESKRAKHYADFFKFRHLEFTAPFSPLDYLAAIEHCRKKGAGIIIVDSMSHEHEGPGGVLEMHEKELDRIAGNDRAKRDRANLLAWARPKAERRLLINGLLQMNCNFIFCFRAKEKVKPVKKDGRSEVEQQGWMPIAGEEFVYEQTVNCLLMPGSKGVPTWSSENPGERAMMKLPGQFRGIFERPASLSEDIGRKLAEWAKGGAVQPASTGAMQTDAAIERVPEADASSSAEEPSTSGPVHQDEKPMPEFGPADAMEMGRVARQKGAQRKAIPGEWRDGTPEHDAWVEAWQAGWDQKDEEIKAKIHT
jgi:ABC-type oligopeptide transport system ATPase subunit